MATPKCFISYSWDPDPHKDWVRNLAEQLVDKDVEVLLDQWDVSPGSDLPKYMETSVREADFVFLVCTPAFAQKANAGRGGVGYEKSIVTGEIFSNTVRTEKFVALLRVGDPRNSLPSYLKSKVFLDFRTDSLFSSSFESLLRHIYNEPRFVRPPRGKKPTFSESSARRPEASYSGDAASELPVYCSRCGAVPGKPSECKGWYRHDFIKNTDPVYCSRCGAVPGKPSECKGWYRHDFIKNTDPVYCNRCGAVPGESSECKGYYRHDFIKISGP